MGQCWHLNKFWEDSCQHGHDAYVGSFMHQDHDIEFAQKLDVYVFQDPNFGAEVCIRYGNAPSEYYSPGPLDGFIQTCSHMFEGSLYGRALKMIRKEGKLRWERKPSQDNSTAT